MLTRVTETATKEQIPATKLDKENARGDRVTSRLLWPNLNKADKRIDHRQLVGKGF